MDWTQVLTVFVIVATNLGTVIGLYIHSDNKMEAGRKETDQKMEANRKETAAIVNAIRQDMKDFHESMKDFHGRLCTIEERRLRLLEK